MKSSYLDALADLIVGLGVPPALLLSVDPLIVLALRVEGAAVGPDRRCTVDVAGCRVTAWPSHRQPEIWPGIGIDPAFWGPRPIRQRAVELAALLGRLTGREDPRLLDDALTDAWVVVRDLRHGRTRRRTHAIERRRLRAAAASLEGRWRPAITALA